MSAARSTEKKEGVYRLQHAAPISARIHNVQVTISENAHTIISNNVTGMHAANRRSRHSSSSPHHLKNGISHRCSMSMVICYRENNECDESHRSAIYRRRNLFAQTTQGATTTDAQVDTLIAETRLRARKAYIVVIHATTADATAKYLRYTRPKRLSASLLLQNTTRQNL